MLRAARRPLPPRMARARGQALETAAYGVPLDLLTGIAPPAHRNYGQRVRDCCGPVVADTLFTVNFGQWI